MQDRPEPGPLAKTNQVQETQRPKRYQTGAINPDSGHGNDSK